MISLTEISERIKVEELDQGCFTCYLSVVWAKQPFLLQQNQYKDGQPDALTVRFKSSIHITAYYRVCTQTGIFYLQDFYLFSHKSHIHNAKLHSQFGFLWSFKIEYILFQRLQLK